MARPKSNHDLAILTAPLFIANPRWTSEELAKTLGLSQSAVARCWSNTYRTDELPSDLPAQFELIEVQLANSQCALVVRKSTSTSTIQPATNCDMRSPRRIPLQTLLAANLIEHSTSEIDFANLEAQIVRDPALLVISTTERAENPQWIQVENWQGLLGYLIAASHPTQIGALHDLQHALVVWANNKPSLFVWKNNRFNPISEVVTTTTRITQRSMQQVLIDQVFELIVSEIWSGRIGGGDRIPESSLARKLRTTRGQTREALRALAANRLIDFHQVRGVLVPSPTLRDITDIYSAKRALGSEILRRAIEDPRLDLDRINSALGEVIKQGKSGNSYETGNADLRFQNEFAESTQMRNIPLMLADLNRQLQIYIAVLGLTYVFSIDHMVRDDIEIFQALTNRDVDSALIAWNRKIDESLAYMSSQVVRLRG